MGTEKGIFDHGMKGMLPAHPLSPATLKESTIRAQLLLFKNKTEEEEDKDEENCRLLLKAGVEGEGVGSLRAGGHSRGCCLGEMRRLVRAGRVSGTWGLDCQIGAWRLAFVTHLLCAGSPLHVPALNSL